MEAIRSMFLQSMRGVNPLATPSTRTSSPHSYPCLPHPHPLLDTPLPLHLTLSLFQRFPYARPCVIPLYYHNRLLLQVYFPRSRWRLHRRHWWLGCLSHFVARQGTHPHSHSHPYLTFTLLLTFLLTLSCPPLSLHCHHQSLSSKQKANSE